MKHKVLMSFVLIILLVPLTGCWNRRELNELAIAVAMGIDKSGEQYQVSAQIVNPGEIVTQKGGGTNSPIVTLTSTGDSMMEAVRKMTIKSPRKIYFAHLRLFVIGEELAREEGIAKTLDLISRDPEFRTDFFIIVAKETTAEQVLKIFSIPLEKIPANKMFESLETSQKVWAVTATQTLDELISDLVAAGTNPLLTGVEVTGDPARGEKRENIQKTSPQAILKINGMAAFYKDKLVGWLNEDESKGANFINDKVKSTVVTVQCPKKGNISVELIRSKTKVSGKVVNGRPEVDVTVRTEANVAEVQCGEVDLSKTQTIYDLETKTEQAIQSDIEAALNKAQKDYKSDIFGFGEAIHKADPAYWKKAKKDWKKEFVNLQANIKVDVKIRRIGTLSKSFLNELKE
ncbi:Ger(x)C family spore germination protein [Bacillus canaveralius]|uniref:Ger(X)C family spore germination protein n=1 Tax=Bacillus canaveralius TaxID=1403243 RepID=A0A2N5GIA8_9BACI|nr:MULTISPECIES: Ger(x)C family spore germination protein [Bacillus]PLR80696.1 Ger(x)C family spore germination protein [Bacillus canaveralius]PLR83852.1 Ger(x)C family spore germination protein [Bacillus sp. V33-4]PLR89113.1 Ger(x)C family spore germination protein [Bacillus canaveralius]RSK48175.1 Ger(x)C family spore germination protein [Bacillus canaveralius]